MKTALIFVCGIALVMGCSSNPPIIPTSTQLNLDDATTLIWNGKGVAYTWKDRGWERSPTFDYVYDVVQKRYETVWKSVKNLHRLHPDYQGGAGPRDQVMYFEVAYKEARDTIESSIRSSIGTGGGETDAEFREQHFTLDLQGMDMAPYNQIRFAQKYLYEEGKLTETVELVKKNADSVVPFMKMEEVARIFVASKGLTPPTHWSKSAAQNP